MDKNKIIAALFDLDGVVFDTETQYDLFWGRQGAIYHPEIPAFHKLIKGQTLVQIYAGHFAGMEAEQQKITQQLHTFEQEMSYEYIPGILEFFSDLRKNGVKIAVVTSSNNEKMKHVDQAHPEFLPLLDALITSDRVKNSKPHPECFLLGASELGANPEHSFVFEDSFHGLEAGNRAGMTVIGLATTNSREAITGKAHLVINNFVDMTFDKLFL